MQPQDLIEQADTIQLLTEKLKEEVPHLPLLIRSNKAILIMTELVEAQTAIIDDLAQAVGAYLERGV